LNDDTLTAVANDAAAGLTVLCGAYRQLFVLKAPGAPEVGTIGRSAPGTRPPVSAHLLDVISGVERLAYWAEEAVCLWTGRQFVRYRLWWNGEPNPLVTLSLGTAARDLPRAAPFAGHAVMPLAASVSREVESVQRILGASGGAELSEDECPLCHERALVRLHSPARLACAMPACPFMTFQIPRKAAHV
jgi:hypothetical protein